MNVVRRVGLDAASSIERERSLPQAENDRPGYASPRVVVGVPLHNNAAFFPSALDSWLGQTYREFVVILVDDASDDGTADLAAALASRDPRVAYVRHEPRVGMCANWRSCVSLALERYPEASYFAWGSDHDLWHRDWLGRMVEALDADPHAVLAYPLAVFINDRDEVISSRPWPPFDTAGVEDVRKRLRDCFLGMKAGNMVYGLYRLDVLARIGGLRDVVGPDQLLMYELALNGTFRQVPEVLWMRRARPLSGKRAILHRQRRSLFARPPLRAYVPHRWTHMIALWWLYGVRGGGKPDIGRGAGLRLGAEVLRLYVWNVYLRARKRTRPVRKAVRKRLRRTWIRTRRPARRAFRRTNRRLRSVALRLPGVRRLRGRELDQTKRSEIN
jgi:glycosyltransferase involved in cell wall biosynthesis